MPTATHCHGISHRQRPMRCIRTWLSSHCRRFTVALASFAVRRARDGDWGCAEGGPPSDGLKLCVASSLTCGEAEGSRVLDRPSTFVSAAVSSVVRSAIVPASAVGRI